MPVFPDCERFGEISGSSSGGGGSIGSYSGGSGSAKVNSLIVGGGEIERIGKSYWRGEPGS